MKTIKCKKPMMHRPEFEGKHHCRQCEREEEKIINNTYCYKPMECHKYFIQRGCRKCGAEVIKKMRG
jgi:hypothetical protein